MTHANATLTPITGLRLARLVVETGWTYAAAAKMFMVAPRTAKKWADRYRSEGPAGMADRTSRRHRCPTKTPTRVVRRIVALRCRHRLDPVQIAGRLGLPASTVHAVLVRCRINRLSRIDRVTGEPLRRYEHDYPGSLIHVDVTKFANIPDGGGWRYVGRVQGRHNAQATARRTGQRGNDYRPRIGTAYLHTVIDWGHLPLAGAHSRVAYAEICSDEKAATAIGVLNRATAWYADRGVTVERVLSDNGSATAPTPGATPAPTSASPLNAPALTGLRPTAKSNASIAPWPTAGPTPGSTSQPSNATPPSPAGSTSTITTASTPPSAANHQSPD